jgi:glycosyltransferase involved in cell wall biosynthesis
MDDPHPQAPELSIVVPAFDEVENLPVLLDELRHAVEAAGRSAEFLIVDDASGDGSGAWLASEALKDERLRPVLLEARAGQSGALAAGFAHARGDIVVTLDADLQNDPADLPRVLAALDGADVVSGIRRHRHDTAVRLISSRIANTVRRWVLGDSITDIGCSFKAYRREALEGLPLFVGAHRFLPALCQARGATVREIEVSHRPRTRGVTKYGIGNRLWRGIHDLLGVRWLRSRLLSPRARPHD